MPWDTNLTCDIATQPLGSRYSVPGFCAIWGAGGDGCRYDACNALGKSGEFGNWQYGSSCGRNINSCDLGSGVAGYHVSCERISWGGGDIPCVFQYINNTTSSCFQGGNQKNGTCNPETRDPRSTLWQQAVFNACVLEADRLESVWNAPTSTCPRAMTIASEAGQKVFVNEVGNAVYQKWFSTYPLNITNPPTFQNRLLELSLLFPEFGSDYLSKNLCSSYTREDLSITGQTITRNFCGCHLPNSQYNEFENNRGVKRECDILCTGASVIPAVDGGLNKLTCVGTYCFIDDITINLNESIVGGITFENACGGCGGVTSSCNCIVRDIDLTVTEGTIGQFNIINSCQGSLECYRTLEDGSVVPVSCSDYERELGVPYVPPEEEDNRRWLLIGILTFVGFVIFFLFIWLLIVLARRRS